MPRHPGRRGRRDARRRRRDARRARHGRAGERPADLAARARHGRCSTTCYLRRGRWIDPARPDEVLASEMFCEAHGFDPGDRVAAVINGRRRWLTIVGVALSPEYVYAIRPGEMFPDQRRFGIFWMDRRALASAFNMEGGFNDVSLRLARGASAPKRHRRPRSPDRAVRRAGRVPQSLQLSAWTLENELRQLQTLRVLRAADLSRRRGVHPERRADACAGAPAPADRGAQGARLLESASWRGTTSSGAW